MGFPLSGASNGSQRIRFIYFFGFGASNPTAQTNTPKHSTDERLSLVAKKSDATSLSLYFADNAAQEGHGRQSLHSGVFAMFGRGANVVIQIVSTIFLARLLMPEDFGVFAMMAALTSLTPVLMDLGTRDAAVQKSRITSDEISALFWLTLGIGILLALATALSSSVIASFYNEDKLENIALVWTLTFIFSALSLQHTALLRRAMMFDKINMIEVGANLFGATSAIVLAFTGFGYWALVLRPILAALVYTVGVWLSCPWIPGLPRMSAGVKEMLTFGTHVTIFAVTDAIGRSADRIALGHTRGAEELGYYQNASALYDNPLGIFNSLHTVAVASLSKLKDNLEELRRTWSIALSSLAFFSMPIFVILAVTGPDVVVLLLGEKWLYAGTILSVVALRGPAQVVERTHGWLHIAAGRPDRWMHWGIVSSLVQVSAVFCGLPFGTMGVATAYTVCMYILFVPAVAYSGRPFAIDVSRVFKVVGPQLVGALCAAVVGFLLRDIYLNDASVLGRIVILVVSCVVSYLIVTVGLFRLVRPLGVAASLLSDSLPARFHSLLPAGMVRVGRKH